MNKPKGQSKNFFRYFLNEYILFRRDFFYEPQLAPEILAEKLDNLDYESKGFGQRKRRILAHVAKVDNQWNFEMLAEQPVTGKNLKHNPSGYRPSANATGIIYSDDDGKTLVEGTVVVNGLQFWGGVVFCLFIIGLMALVFSFFGAPPGEFTFIAVIFLLGMAFYWFQMYQDRNHLANLVERVIESASKPLYD